MKIATFFYVTRPVDLVPPGSLPDERFELAVLAEPAEGFPRVTRIVNAATLLDWHLPLTDDEQQALGRQLEVAQRFLEDDARRAATGVRS